MEGLYILGHSYSNIAREYHETLPNTAIDYYMKSIDFYLRGIGLDENMNRRHYILKNMFTILIHTEELQRMIHLKNMFIK